MDSFIDFTLLSFNLGAPERPTPKNIRPRRERCVATGKKAWHSAKVAERMAASTYGTGLHAYRCEHCGLWHVGHRSAYRQRLEALAAHNRFYAEHECEDGSFAYQPRQADGEGWGWAFSLGVTRHLWLGGRPACGKPATFTPSFYYPLDCAHHETDCQECREAADHSAQPSFGSPLLAPPGDRQAA